jgi:hypothetical protein
LKNSLDSLWITDECGLVDYNLIGMDIAEVAPPHDRSEVTSLAAATLGLESLYCRQNLNSAGLRSDAFLIPQVQK